MIANSVGLAGVNAPADVAQIQTLLNARAEAGLAADGVCGALTIAAIKSFQSTVSGIAVPDGLITPGGPTYAALAAGAAPSTAASAPPPSFPGPTAILIDLSHNNDVDPIDFGSLQRAGVAGILLKASEGAGFRDPTFKQRVAGARQAGLLTGAYHFGTAEDVTAQLNNFSGAVTAAGLDFTMIVAALDVEPNPSGPAYSLSVAQAESWVSAFRQGFRATPLVYGGPGYLGAQGGAVGNPNLAACPLWTARYPGEPSVRPDPVAGWQDWTLWQFSTGSGDCFAGSFGGLISDRSIFRGTPAQLSALWRSLLAPQA